MITKKPFYKKLWFKIVLGISVFVFLLLIGAFLLLVSIMKEIQIDEAREINESVEEYERELKKENEEKQITNQ